MSRDSYVRLRLEDFEEYDLDSVASRVQLRLIILLLLCLGSGVASWTLIAEMSGFSGALFVVAAYITFSIAFVVLYREQLGGRSRAVAIHLGAVDRTRFYVFALASLGAFIAAGAYLGELDDLIFGPTIVALMSGALYLSACTRWFSGRPPSARHRGPVGALRTARNRGLAILLIVGAIVIALSAVAFAFTTTIQVAVGAGAVLGLVVGVVFGLEHGLEFWLHFAWFRHRLWLSGQLPRRLPAFLDWCTEDERRWLRQVSDTYEFRHRELLDHLASDQARLAAIRQRRLQPEEGFKAFLWKVLD